MTSLEEALGHEFRRPQLLSAALTHRSYTAENPEAANNERHEFLGDAVLQLAITDHLFSTYPRLSEGQLAKVRAASVNRTVLASVAREIGLGDGLLIGRGEEASGGREKDSILADAMEAVIAAVYLDAGFGVARTVVMRHWAGRIPSSARRPGGADFKTRLQEVLAAAGLRPVYEVEGAGPDHARVFVARVLVDGKVRGAGEGRSKKEAEQEAAKAALGSGAGAPV
ncbi:MAG TPA: ribonuclease III [Acidimicrobiia bacterium]|jgi:ribonuclease-3